MIKMHKRPFGIVSSLDAKSKSALYTKASLLRLKGTKRAQRKIGYATQDKGIWMAPHRGRSRAHYETSGAVLPL